MLNNLRTTLKTLESESKTPTTSRLGSKSVQIITSYVEQRTAEFQLIFNSLAALEQDIGSSLVTKEDLLHHVQEAMKMELKQALKR